MLAYLLDEDEFLGPYGIRSLSKYHLEHPFVFNLSGQDTKSNISPQNRTPGCSAAILIGGARYGCL
jgi:hypothetical protein